MLLLSYYSIHAIYSFILRLRAFMCLCYLVFPAGIRVYLNILYYNNKDVFFHIIIYQLNMNHFSFSRRRRNKADKIYSEIVILSFYCHW